MFNYKNTGLVASAKIPVFQLLQLQDAYQDSRRLNPNPAAEATAEHRETVTLLSDPLKPKRFPDFHHDIGSTLRSDPSSNDADFGGSLAINLTVSGIKSSPRLSIRALASAVLSGDKDFPQNRWSMRLAEHLKMPFFLAALSDTTHWISKSHSSSQLFISASTNSRRYSEVCCLTVMSMVFNR